MVCSKGRIAPAQNTKLRLFADSGGYCQNPYCLSPLFRDIDHETIHIAEIAHVISAGDSGPRSSSTMSEEERAGYENLILLCPTCHTIIDKAEESYPEVLILNWKSDHKRKISNSFGLRSYSSRQEVRDAITPLFRENYTIFTIYGPMTEERLNPESHMPAQWLRKVRSQIIPNNRKILYIADANATFLTEEEKKTLELFRQHVLDFEAFLKRVKLQ